MIGQMLEHNLAAIRYSAYDFFVGVYPNDEQLRDRRWRMWPAVDPRVGEMWLARMTAPHRRATA